jgi:Tol biopolymer transport system component
MPLAIGTRVGAYEILGHLGSGGMGEVYRARDTKLGRDVALKVLPESFAGDPERLARFKREAQVLAALNHPNIAHIHGYPDADGIHALVMELVDGPTLADRIAKSAIPLDEALPIAKQIAEALEAAHEQGIIHRDLKPANVKVREDGTVKVLDFGLAKLLDTTTAGTEAQAYGPGVTNSPTITTPAMTQLGMILGTAAYMSPEQATGRSADKRSDLWAFGCVLYEMLTGTLAFGGEEVTDTFTAILRDEPHWTALPVDTPLAIRRLLRRCLQKDRRQRLQSAGDVRLDIDEGGNELDGPVQTTAVHAGRARERMAWSATLSLVPLGAAALAIEHFREAPLVHPFEMRVEITTPLTSAPMHFALSPDGRSLVFVASGDGTQRLWYRRLDKTDAQPLAGTDDATNPFWSPDSGSVGFFASGRLKRIDVGGGQPQVLATVAVGRGGSWNADGTILFASSAGEPVFRLPASGGPLTPVTRLAAGHAGHLFPQFLPDGQHFIFFVQSNPAIQGIYLGSLDGGEAKRVTPADTAGAFLRPDRVVFISKGRLVAQRLIPTRGELLGNPEVLADHVGYNQFFHGGFTVSNEGQIAYRAGGGDRTQLVWHERTGREAGIAGQPDAQSLLAPELSPDGKRVAVDRTVDANRDVWLMDLARGGLTRLTFGPSVDGFPVWSSDGKQIAFESNRQGRYGLYVKQSSGVGPEAAMADSPNNRWFLDWSRDARFVLYHEDDPKTGSDVWALPMTGSDRTPIAVANTPFSEMTAQFSPDGRFVAYDTNESGQFQVVVQPFPNPTEKWSISIGGGTAPRWRHDGKELYFINPEGKLMAALVRTSTSSLDADAPVPLFQTRMLNNAYKQQYAVSADGRFLINQLVEDAPSPITLILNWKAGPTR